MPNSLADLLHPGHGVVEVAGDLQRQRAVVEGLRQLAVGDFAGTDEDHGLIKPVTEQYRASEALVLPVEAQAARLAPTQPGMAEGRRHAVVLEAARGVHALVLQAEPAGAMPV